MSQLILGTVSKEYLPEGFATDDGRLGNPGGRPDVLAHAPNEPDACR